MIELNSKMSDIPLLNVGLYTVSSLEVRPCLLGVKRIQDPILQADIYVFISYGSREAWAPETHEFTHFKSMLDRISF